MLKCSKTRPESIPTSFLTPQTLHFQNIQPKTPQNRLTRGHPPQNDHRYQQLPLPYPPPRAWKNARICISPRTKCPIPDPHRLLLGSSPVQISDVGMDPWLVAVLSGVGCDEDCRYDGYGGICQEEDYCIGETYADPYAECLWEIDEGDGNTLWWKR